MTEREKGVATAPCGTCGADLALHELPDGSLTTVKCSTCSPDTEKASRKTRRSVATDVPAQASEQAEEVVKGSDESGISTLGLILVVLLIVLVVVLFTGV